MLITPNFIDEVSKENWANAGILGLDMK